MLLRWMVLAPVALVGFVGYAVFMSGEVLPKTELGTAGYMPHFATTGGDVALALYPHVIGSHGSCKGLPLASEMTVVLGELKVIREYCYQQDKADIVLIDPTKVYPWRTTRVRAAEFRKLGGTPASN